MWREQAASNEQGRDECEGDKGPRLTVFQITQTHPIVEDGQIKVVNLETASKPPDTVHIPVAMRNHDNLCWLC